MSDAQKLAKKFPGLSQWQTLRNNMIGMSLSLTLSSPSAGVGAWGALRMI